MQTLRDRHQGASRIEASGHIFNYFGDLLACNRIADLALGYGIQIFFKQLDASVDLCIGETIRTKGVKTHHHTGTVTIDVKAKDFYCVRQDRPPMACKPFGGACMP